MKALVLSLFLLAILATQLPGSVAGASDCTAGVCKATVTRTIVTNNWGVTFVSDEISLNASSPVSHLTLGVPSSLSSNLRFTQAVDSGSTQLRVSAPTTQPLPSPMVGNYSALDIAFPSAKTGTYTFNVTSVYTHLLNINATSNNFLFTFEPFPFTDGSFNVTNAHLSVNTSDWPSPKTTGINGTFASATFTTKTMTLQAFNTTLASMSFSTTGTSQTILDVIANRTITLAQTGAIQVTDYYNITNKGRDLTSISLPLPKYVQSATASDIIPSVATLAAAPASDGTNAVTFSPRFSTIRAGGGASTRITYSLPTQNYLTSKGLGRYELNFRMFDNVKFVEPSLTVKIITPMGFHLDSISGQTFTSTGNQITLQISQVTPLSNVSFVMDYQLDPFWASLSALGWAGLAVGSIAAAVLAVGSTSMTGASISGAPSELIMRFVDLYDEKSAMRLEAEKMDEDLSRGALNRHEYKRRRRVIDLRIAELDRTLAPIKDQLSKANPRYQDMIKRLERAEADIQVVRTTTTDLKNQYRSQRIARELYESLTSDLARRKGKAQQTLDTIVINLREETR
jgi:hypothetical protein